MTQQEVPLLRFRNLSELPWLIHGVSTRHGGVSEGRHASLNTSYTVEDVPERVDENLRRLAAAADIAPASLAWAYQVHGAEATVLDEIPSERPHCDILATRSPGVVPALRFADCTPILLVDPRQRAVAAAHAGWRGTALRTAAAAVGALRQAFQSEPRDLLVGIGPTVGACCYTVGPDVEQAFADRPWALIREERGAQARLDLVAANLAALEEAGVPRENVEVAEICTQCHADTFFSHRANGGRPAGRFAAFVGIRS